MNPNPAPDVWSPARWPGNPRVRGVFTGRRGGCSHAPYDDGSGGGGLNLGSHVGDQAQAVQANRERLAQALGAVRVAYLDQVHGTVVADLDTWDGAALPPADAVVCSRAGIGACVLVADCLPVLMAAPAARAVAAAHAGWRGLAAGVLEQTLRALCAKAGCAPQEVQLWLGPCIGPRHFEVGPEVREAFLAHQAQATEAFVPGARPGKWLADLHRLAALRLQAAGVLPQNVGETAECTVQEAQRYYSFRRDGVTGRQAGVIWIEP